MFFPNRHFFVRIPHNKTAVFLFVWKRKTEKREECVKIATDGENTLFAPRLFFSFCVVQYRLFYTSIFRIVVKHFIKSNPRQMWLFWNIHHLHQKNESERNRGGPVGSVGDTLLSRRRRIRFPSEANNCVREHVCWLRLWVLNICLSMFYQLFDTRNTGSV